MGKWWSGRYANVVSTLALIVAMAGGAYAAIVPRNSVGTKQIRPDAVRSGDVRDSTLTGADVRDGRLTGADLAPDSLTGTEISEAGLAEVPSAANAQTLQGQLPGAFLGANATAANADKVDNIDSTDLVRGSGRLQSYAANPPAGTNLQFIQDTPIDIDVECPADPTTEEAQMVTFEFNMGANQFIDDGSEDPSYTQGREGTLTEIGPGPDMVTYQRYANGRVDTVWLSYVGRATSCHVQAMWLGSESG